MSAHITSTLPEKIRLCRSQWAYFRSRVPGPDWYGTATDAEYHRLATVRHYQHLKRLSPTLQP